MSDSPCVRPTVEELARFPLFAEDDRDALHWLADHFEIRCFEAGDVLIQEGAPAVEFFVVLEGEIHYRMTGDAYGSVFVRVTGQPNRCDAGLPVARVGLPCSESCAETCFRDDGPDTGNDADGRAHGEDASTREAFRWLGS